MAMWAVPSATNNEAFNAVNGLWLVGKTAFTATLITVNMEIALAGGAH